MVSAPQSELRFPLCSVSKPPCTSLSQCPPPATPSFSSSLGSDHTLDPFALGRLRGVRAGRLIFLSKPAPRCRASLTLEMALPSSGEVSTPPTPGARFAPHRHVAQFPLGRPVHFTAQYAHRLHLTWTKAVVPMVSPPPAWLLCGPFCTWNPTECSFQRRFG